MRLERVPAHPTATLGYRVRFDEAAPDGLVRTAVLMRYAQDVAWEHSEQLGFDRTWYTTRRLFWVVRAAELAVLAPMPVGTNVLVTTAVTGMRKVWARRRTEGRLPDGTLAFWVHTDWVITDARGMPTRVPPEFTALSESAGSFAPGRVSLPPMPPDPVVTGAIARHPDLDPWGHVNNAAFLDYLDDAVLAAGDRAAETVGAIPRAVRLEILLPAARGARLQSSVWSVARDGEDDRDTWAWRLTDDDAGELARGMLTDGRGKETEAT